jgi:hypothetical protein
MNVIYFLPSQPCSWDIVLDRVLETEIELEERTKLDHSFVSIYTTNLIDLMNSRHTCVHIGSKDIFYFNLL